MNVFIRVDASRLIGSGHVMRCLTLAFLFKKDGNSVEFICRDLPGNLIKLIQERGYICNVLPFSDEQKDIYSSIELNDNYDEWRGVLVETDYMQSQAVLKEKDCHLLVIDHYGIDEKWEAHLRSYTTRIMAIDDLADRKHDCDILLDHNFYLDYESRYDELVSSNCLKLLGPGHALINPELRKVKQRRIELGKSLNPKKIGNVLIFLGGMDVKNYTDSAIQKALSSELTKYSVLNVVLGKHNPHKEKLKYKYAKYDNVVFHVQPSYYYELMIQADMAIGASGVSQLERLFIGLGSLTTRVAQNQDRIWQDGLSLRGIVDFNDLDKEKFTVEGRSVEVKLLDLNELYKAYDSRVINIVTPDKGWFLNHAIKLSKYIRYEGFNVNLIHSHKLIKPGSYISVYLSYPHLVPQEYLGFSNSNIVVHASDLPKGKGWSPWVWEILNGADEISLSLIELVEKLDSGPVYMKESISLSGHELINEIRGVLSEKIYSMVFKFVTNKPKYIAIPQKGESTFYPRRSKQDSELLLNVPLKQYFNLLRVVDNDLYPAFFKHNGYKYILKIFKEKQI